ncbi:hypothetical protein [Crateriforma conspicua]|uniref:Uncharacterized protein n=1 Tax=Crateriforma conspicua TaxID=2527996 RepID=A0A5C5Y304_9PLAN|nr:hypothetical protein [Crateriforma conspicua]TWT69358.1 hypothetical protein Pan14r_16440 [Crateriforma conspicua]
MGLLEAVKQLRRRDDELVQENLAAERSELFRIVVRDFLGTPEDDDAERLHAILALLGLSDADYERLLKGCGVVCNATANLKAAEKLSSGTAAKCQKCQATMYEAEAASRKARSEMKHWSDKGLAKSSAAKAFATAKKDYPELFDGDGNLRSELKAHADSIESGKLDHDSRVLSERLAAIDEWMQVMLEREGLPKSKKAKKS